MVGYLNLRSDNRRKSLALGLVGEVMLRQLEWLEGTVRKTLESFEAPRKAMNTQEQGQVVRQLIEKAGCECRREKASVSFKLAST